MKRLASMATGLLALAACSSPRGLAHPEGGAAGTGGQDAGQDAGRDAAPATKTYAFQATLNRDVDMLFMIDNSIGMSFLQNKLASSFPPFINALESLPGGLPNLHLAVVSSDMGAGRYTAADIPSCRTGGDQGTFQAMQRGPACASGSLNAGQMFITASAGNSPANYTGDLASTLTCIAGLGDTGCALEHQFASLLRALGADGAAAPATNAGFLRPSAYLFVVLFTNEDDCSAPPLSMLFDPNSRFVSDPLGPLSSYRCNEFGHLCGGARPPRTNIPANGMDLSGTCVSAEDGTLLRVSDVVARLKALKTDPSRVFVAAIAGPPTPYVVDTGPATLKDDPIQAWPAVRHSCISAAAAVADPAVRISQLVDAFGSNGVFQVICNDSFTPALDLIVQRLGKTISGEPCLDAGIDPATCTFVDSMYTDQGARVDTPLPSCLANGNQAPCWSASSAASCGAGRLLLFNRPPGPTAPDLITKATCPLAGP